jgi:cytochrome P450 family 103
LRHEDVSRLIKDARLRATETAMPAQGGISQGALFDIFEHGMLTANGEVHARRRRAMSKALANQLAKRFRQQARRAADALIEANYFNGRLDLATGYAAKLPVLALGALLGVPASDMTQFMADILAMNEFFRPAPSEAAVLEAEAAAARLRGYLEELAGASAKQPESFLGQYLGSAEEEGLERLEVLIQIVQLIVGGTESMRTAMVAQTMHLLADRQQWKAICEDPALVPNAVAEGLRIEPGIAGVVRLSVEDIEIDRMVLPAGQLVILSFLSALRDEQVFERPDTFDISRPNLHQARLAFGGGAHKCVAEAFARVELEEGLSALARCFPTLRLDGITAFHGHTFVRKTTQCQVKWTL